MLKKIIQKTSTIFILALTAIGTLAVYAAFQEPGAAPSASNQDYTQNILGANNNNNGFLSSSVATDNPAGSIIERLKYIIANQKLQIYSFQKNQTVDDNSGSDSTVEEAVWSAEYTDSDISTQYIASGKVKKDTRTGLYWSDCYSATLGGGGSCGNRANSFALDGSLLEYDDGLDAETGNAVNFCEGLVLDPDGSGDKTDWYLPSLKELLQAYIDGASNNLPNTAYLFLTSTETAEYAAYAWGVTLNVGTYDEAEQAVGNKARCVRSETDNAP